MKRNKEIQYIFVQSQEADKNCIPKSFVFYVTLRDSATLSLIYKRLCLGLLKLLPGASHNAFNLLATHLSSCTMFLIEMLVREH
ncbi:hypothetical protein GQX74_012796 [Glossina fuscipes]|nr:hypothetical protein GQX74_012796 [Glossina fuscipes]